MKLLSIIGLLVATLVGSINACAHRHHHHQHHLERAQLHALRAKLMKVMDMSEEDLRNVDMEAIAEAKQMIPRIDAHPLPEFEKSLILEETDNTLAFREHLFKLPGSDGSLIKAWLTFFVRPVNTATTMKIVITARELGSDTPYHVASDDFATLDYTKQLRMQVPTDLVMRWAATESQSITLSITVQGVDPDVIVFRSDVDSSGKEITLELHQAIRSRRKRTAELSKQQCKKDETDQECCISSKTILFSDIGMRNIIAPSYTLISWCEGTCKEDASFPHVFDKFDTRLFTGKHNSTRCCHSTGGEHVDIMFINSAKQVKNERIYDIKSTGCSCY